MNSPKNKLATVLKEVAHTKSSLTQVLKELKVPLKDTNDYVVKKVDIRKIVPPRLSLDGYKFKSDHFYKVASLPLLVGLDQGTMELNII